MKAVVVCVSVSHGNTAKVAGVIAHELGADVAEPEMAVNQLGDCDLLGVGSGIFGMAFHPRLRQFAEGLPAAPPGAKAFVFWTSGGPLVPFWSYSHRMRTTLEGKGYEVIGAFSCRGWDTWWPLRLVGGLNKGHPNQSDLNAAREFAKGLRERFGDERAAAPEPTA